VTESITGENTLPICDECGRVFSTKRGLASHMKKHDQPTLCPRCGKSVRYLAAHLKAEHPLEKHHENALHSVQALIEENRGLKARVAELESRSGDSAIPPFPLPLGERGMGGMTE
jgi:queuine/archaeosine tRNA-ribosyltransferase